MTSLGQTDLEIDPIIFGAWAIGGWHWGGCDDDVSIRAIHASIDAGIRCFDTAPIYGLGHSETVLGKAIKGKRHQVKIFGKVGLRWNKREGAHYFDTEINGQETSIWRNLRPDSIRYEVESSLQRLQCDYIDLIQCHKPDPSFPVEETMCALKQLRQEGKVLEIGVSSFDVELLQRSKDVLGDVPLASMQPRYSLLNRLIEKDILPWTIANQVGNIVYSPLERGLLTGKVTLDRVFPDSDGRSKDPMFSQSNRNEINRALKSIASLCAEHRCSYAQLAAAWCFHQDGVQAAIVGARSPQQAIENAGAAQISLSTEESTLLHNTFAQLACCKR